ncbi:hypothetical protein LCGC14_0386580 [marine sediment metagenome]|uniref:Uncharacterized protein n=1 Tax=marine sediment metagenome TaxID=412755 RepID=A0A0F9T6U4_9ZZZZ
MDYEKQGTDFLESTNTELRVEYAGQGLHFPEDTMDRDIYTITLVRNYAPNRWRSYCFNFGQSVERSGPFCLYGDPTKGVSRGKATQDWEHNPKYAKPTAYDVLSCLTKHDQGTFEDFCAESGEDTDSRRAERAYNATKDEYANLCRLFSDAELEAMEEIA